jgi:hypothetical protein
VPIDYTDPADDPDEPDHPPPPDGLRSPDTAPPRLDQAERATIGRAYQDLVKDAYTDYSQGTSDTTDKPASSDGGDSLYCPVSELKGDEPGTAERLMESRDFTGGTLRGFKDPTGNPDYIDEYKRTYDAVGGPSAWAAPELNMNGMINQIKRHLYQKAGVDFTVLDLTSASSHQIDEVFESLDRWAADPSMHPLSKLIVLGDDFLWLLMLCLQQRILGTRALSPGTGSWNSR